MVYFEREAREPAVRTLRDIRNAFEEAGIKFVNEKTWAGAKLANKLTIFHMLLGFEVIIVGLILSADSFSAAVAIDFGHSPKKMQLNLLLHQGWQKPCLL